MLHSNEVSDAVVGLIAGYLLWNHMMPTGPRAISIVEQITHRQLGPIARGVVSLSMELRGDPLPR